MNSNELEKALGRAAMKPTSLLERLLEAVERQNEIAELLLSPEQKAALAQKDQERKDRALAKRHGPAHTRT